jgi:hypothetical protein
VVYIIYSLKDRIPGRGWLSVIHFALDTSRFDHQNASGMMIREIIPLANIYPTFRDPNHHNSQHFRLVKYDHLISFTQIKGGNDFSNLSESFWRPVDRWPWRSVSPGWGRMDRHAEESGGRVTSRMGGGSCHDWVYTDWWLAGFSRWFSHVFKSLKDIN